VSKQQATVRERVSAVPGAPVRVCHGIGCFGEGARDAVPVLGGGREVDRGPDEWMRGLDSPAYSEQTRVHCRSAAAMSTPSVSAARWSSKGSPSGSAAAARTSSCASE